MPGFLPPIPLAAMLMATGALGGVAGKTLTAPADVYTSRAQARPAGDRSGWTAIECAKMARAEVVGALYRGFVRQTPPPLFWSTNSPASVLRGRT